MYQVYVYENYSDIDPILIGILYIDQIRNKETYSFEYDQTWLNNNNKAITLDPMLPFEKGRLWNNETDILFAMFEDTCPDRWGRTLFKRKEEALAKQEGRSPKKLNESDYLLGVDDYLRAGALRFSLTNDGTFLANNEIKIPPIARLRQLEAISIAYEDDISNTAWINELLNPGSSLGGARPKANVIDNEGNLWIAKFPSKKDEINVGAWEKVVQDLARDCGLYVTDSDLKTFNNLGGTFLSKRFDRDKDKRIHFASAMTLLGKKDGDSDTVSFLDLLNIIKTQGHKPKQDSKELFKRLIFNIAVSNSDNHLRNHGFLLEPNKGWYLAPLYDVNPDNLNNTSAISLDGTNYEFNYHIALDIASYFELDKTAAIKEIINISEIVNNNWLKYAKALGISNQECTFMQAAFTRNNQEIDNIKNAT